VTSGRTRYKSTPTPARPAARSVPSWSQHSIRSVCVSLSMQIVVVAAEHYLYALGDYTEADYRGLLGAACARQVR